MKEFGRAKHAFRHLSLATSMCALALLIAGTANAQTAPPAPIRPKIDANGVDLFNGTLYVQAPAISVGGNGNGISSYFWSDVGGLSPSYLGYIEISGSSYTVSIGSSSDTFTLAGSTFTSAQGDGATLAVTGSPNTYTYTARDGTVATFAHAYYNSWAQYGSGGLGNYPPLR